MIFGQGDPVHVAALGKGIVREVRNGGRYLVEIKGRSLIVTGDQLTPAVPARPERRRKESADGTSEKDTTDRPPRSLDLHGKTVDEAIDSLDEFVNAALLDDAPEVRIVHGKSGGRIKTAVHARLAQLPSIRGFRLDPRNPGVTIVTL